jgi:hypothetical protein
VTLLKEEKAAVGNKRDGLYQLLYDIERDPKLNPLRGQKRIPGQSGKETVAGAHKRPKLVPHYNAQDTQALLRLWSSSGQACSGSDQVRSPSAQVCSPSAYVCSPSAQIKAAPAHVRRLKRNQRRGNLILSLWVLRTSGPFKSNLGQNFKPIWVRG